MGGYVEFRHWSIVLGCDASRLSVFDARGQEYWRIVSRETSGKRYRELRQATVEELVDAIERGDEPGEVV